MSEKKHSNPLKERFELSWDTLTPKARILADYILKNSLKVVFMTTTELAESCNVSVATVIRFVNQLGYKGYGKFLQELRDVVNDELTMVDRVALTKMKGPDSDRFQRIIMEEIENLRGLYEGLDMETVRRVVESLYSQKNIYVVGSRLSYSLSHFLGWSLTKVRKGIHILRGSDLATIDWLLLAPSESLVIILATSRYPNELMRMGKVAKRLGHMLVIITDNSLCPLNQFADYILVAPTKQIPFISNQAALVCLINYLVEGVSNCDPEETKRHQELLLQHYRENDILFGMG
jgi:DNA-binding MurR/RpiR family transcriptional regulator